MRLVVIGAVAAGTSASAKARRNSEDTEIVRSCIHKQEYDKIGIWKKMKSESRHTRAT